MATSCCYACGALPGSHRRAVDDRWSIATCPECGLEFTVPLPSDDELRRFYSDYVDVRAGERIVEMNALEHLETLSRFGWTSMARTLDFGSGTGVFIRIAGENCYGVEWGGPGAERVVSSLADVDGEWDFVTMWGVLEHLTDPAGTVASLAARLTTGGYLVLTTVDAEGEIPYRYKPPEHLSYWTRDALDALARRCGLAVVECQPYEMWQTGAVYLDRLLARTPREYSDKLNRPQLLPDVVRVPTNEVRVVMRRAAAE